MSASAQHSVILGIEGIHVPGSSESLGGGGRVGQCLDSGSTVMGGDSCGAPFYLIDGDSERSSQQGCIVLYLMRQVEFYAAADGDRCTKQSPCVLQHEIHHLGCNHLGRTDEVAFILTVFVVYHDHELPLAEIVQSLLNGI